MNRIPGEKFLFGFFSERFDLVDGGVHYRVMEFGALGAFVGDALLQSRTFAQEPAGGVVTSDCRQNVHTAVYF